MKIDKNNTNEKPFLDFLQDPTYGPGGLFFFPGLSVLALNLFNYVPLSRRLFSHSLKEWLLYDLRQQENLELSSRISILDRIDDILSDDYSLHDEQISQLSLEDQLEYFTEKGYDSNDSIIMSLNYPLEEKKEAQHIGRLRKNMKEIYDYLQNWSTTDLLMSLSYRIILREAYPNLKYTLDKKIAEFFSSNELSCESQLNSISQVMLDSLPKVNQKPEPQSLDYTIWYMILHNLILNSNTAFMKSDVSGKTLPELLQEFLENNNLIPKEKKFLAFAFSLCLERGHFSKEIPRFSQKELPSASIPAPSQGEDAEGNSWQTEILFHSASVFNRLSAERVEFITREKTLPDLFFYKDRLLFCLELCGIKKSEALPLVDQTLKEKNTMFLIQFLEKGFL